MKRIIEIKEITLGEADQYNYQSYPSPGIYKHEKDTYNTYFIANNQVWSVPDNQIITEPFVEPSKGLEGVSVETMLKTLAVAQKPELVIELAKNV